MGKGDRRLGSAVHVRQRIASGEPVGEISASFPPNAAELCVVCWRFLHSHRSTTGFHGRPDQRTRRTWPDPLRRKSSCRRMRSYYMLKPWWRQTSITRHLLIYWLGVSYALCSHARMRVRFVSTATRALLSLSFFFDRSRNLLVLAWPLEVDPNRPPSAVLLTREEAKAFSFISRFGLQRVGVRR